MHNYIVDVIKDNAERINAHVRISLRRWLFRYIPTRGQYLKYKSIESLSKEVLRYGGDPDRLIQEAKDHITERIIQEYTGVYRRWGVLKGSIVLIRVLRSSYLWATAYWRFDYGKYF